MKLGRGIVGVVAGIALWSTLVRMLETALISAIAGAPVASAERSEEHTSELQSH